MKSSGGEKEGKSSASSVGRACSKVPSKPVLCAAARSRRPLAPSCQPCSGGALASFFSPRAPSLAQAKGGTDAVDLTDADGETKAIVQG